MILCDTGPLVAAADRDDADNRSCTDLFAGMHLARRPILVPAPVVAEVGYLLARAGGARVESALLQRWGAVARAGGTSTIGPPPHAGRRRARRPGADRCGGPGADAGGGDAGGDRERLDVADRLDGAIGPIKQSRRGHAAGKLLVGTAAARLAWEGFWVGLDRQRAHTAGQQPVPVPELAATTAAGLARRLGAAQWAAGSGPAAPEPARRAA